MPRIFTNTSSRTSPGRIHVGGAASSPAPVGPVPSDKSGLLFWFKADALSLNDLDPVSSWVDSNGGTAATNIGPLRPTYRTNQINGKPAVVFTAASNQYLDFGAANNVDEGAVCSVVMVAFTAVTTGFRAALTMKSSTVGRNLSVFAANQAGYGDINWGFTRAVAQPSIKATGVYTGSYHTFLLNYNAGSAVVAGSYTSTRDGVALVPSVANNNSAAVSSNILGGFAGLGAGSFWDGPIAEVFAYNSQCTAGEITTTLAPYILTKYGLVL